MHVLITVILSIVFGCVVIANLPIGFNCKQSQKPVVPPVYKKDRTKALTRYQNITLQQQKEHQIRLYLNSSVEDAKVHDENQRYMDAHPQYFKHHIS